MLHFIYIFSTNISTEYFKHASHSPFFSSKCRLFHNATFFFGSCISHILLKNLNVKLRCQKFKGLNPTGPFCTHGRFSICPAAKDRKTDWKCCQCLEWVCKDHLIMTIQLKCDSCKEQSYCRQISYAFMF